MAANEVVYFSSDETGAPTLNNAAGSMINVLDACLINGFNVKSVASIVVASAVATATITGHGYLAGRMIDIAGATPSGLNGRKLILAVVSANAVTFAATGISDQTATGTITAKRSPLGWVKQFAGTNKAMYSRSDVTATAMLLRIDDTGASPASAGYARALMVETATDVDTYTGPAPTEAMLSGGQYWSKGQNNTTAKQWRLVGDGVVFYFFADDRDYPYSNYGGLHPQGFGDAVSYKAGDAYGCMLMGQWSEGAAYMFMNQWQYHCVFSRQNNGIGEAVRAQILGAGHNTSSIGGTGAYPSPVDNGMVLQAPMFVREQSATYSDPIRGQMRGLIMPMANALSLHGQVLTGLTGFAGSVLFVGWSAVGQVGAIGIDLTGPWG